VGWEPGRGRGWGERGAQGPRRRARGDLFLRALGEGRGGTRSHLPYPRLLHHPGAFLARALLIRERTQPRNPRSLAPRPPAQRAPASASPAPPLCVGAPLPAFAENHLDVADRRIVTRRAAQGRDCSGGAGCGRAGETLAAGTRRSAPAELSTASERSGAGRGGTLRPGSWGHSQVAASLWLQGRMVAEG
jgi:hypothetical protein